jgi:hypothetical protein
MQVQVQMRAMQGVQCQQGGAQCEGACDASEGGGCGCCNITGEREVAEGSS